MTQPNVRERVVHSSGRQFPYQRIDAGTIRTCVAIPGGDGWTSVPRYSKENLAAYQSRRTTRTLQSS